MPATLTIRILAVLLIAGLGLVPTAGLAEELELPTKGPPSTPLPEVTPTPSGGSTRTPPSVIVTPPTGSTEAAPSRHTPRWKFVPRGTLERAMSRAKQRREEEAAPNAPPTIQAIVLVPGSPLADPEGASTQAWVAALPLPPGFVGVRDLGTAVPGEVVGKLKHFLGENPDRATLEKLKESLVFALGASGRRVGGVHLPLPTTGTDGVVRIVILDAAGG